MFNELIHPFRQAIFNKSNSTDVSLFSILFLIIPIALITGPAIPDIIVSLIAFYFLIKSVLHKQWNYYKNPIFFGFFIFSCYGIIRSLFSDMPIESLTNEGSLFYFRYIFFAMGTWFLLDKNPQLSKCIMTVSILCLILVCFDGLFQYLFGTNIFGIKAISSFRITGLFGNEPIMGRYIAMLSIFTFALIYQNILKTKRYFILAITFLVMSEVVVFLSGERVPLFYVTIFSISIIIFLPFYRFYRIIGFLVSTIIIIVILQYNPSAKERMITQTLKEISTTKLSYLPYNKSYEEHYVSAIAMFYDSPLFGVGTNTFRFQSQKTEYNPNKFDINSHPHNYYIQTLAELGIFGFMFLVIFYLYLLLQLLRHFYFVITDNSLKQMPFNNFLYLLILFIYWWPIIPHMSLYNNWNNVLLMLPLGFFMKYFFSNPKNENSTNF